MYELKVLIAALKQVKRPNIFLWNLLINGIKEENKKKFEVHFKKSRRLMAPFTAPFVAGELLEKEGFYSREFEPGVVKPLRRANANELFEQQFGQTIYGNSVSTADVATGQMAEELIELDESIVRRELWMLGQYLTTGIVPIVGKTVDRAIKYYSDNIEALGGTDKWDNAASNPIDDIKRWQLKIQKDTGTIIDSIIMTPAAASAFRNHPKVIEQLKLTQADQLRVNPRSLGDGVTFIGTIPDLNVDIYTYVDWVINPVSGLEESIIPEGGVIACKAKSIKVHYGAIAQIVDKKRQIFVGARIPKHWIDETNDNEFIRLASAPLIVPEDADAHYYSKVV